MEREEIKKICEELNIQKYFINEDGSLNVMQNVNISNKGLDHIPLRFKSVQGYFSCSENKLTSLFGCPDIVTTNFYCNDNELLTLEHSPKMVMGDFLCNQNKITSLVGCTESIGGSFYFQGNNLNNLEHFPKVVIGKIYAKRDIDEQKDAYFDLFLNILDSHNYPLYDNFEDTWQLMDTVYREDFKNWINMRRRINTINDIIS